MFNFKNKNKFFKSVLLLLIVSVLLFQHINLSNVFGEEEDYSFTLAVLPDTQKYSAAYPDIFNQQTQWIVDNKENLNIVFVSQLGDLIQNFETDFELEEIWENARESMDKLDGILPYAVLPGNHDYDYDVYPYKEATMFESYFPVSKFEHESWWGGDYEDRNSYQLFSVGEMDFIILHLEYLAPDNVLMWSADILNEYTDRRAIVVTHLYLEAPSGIRNSYPRYKRDGWNAGEQMWDELIKNHCNIFMVLSGHWHGEAMQTSINDCGTEVFEIVQDYSSRENGGDGWLRYFVFKPLEDKIYAFTYSPYLDEFERDEDSEFVLDYEM